MNATVEAITVLKTLSSFLRANEGDEATQEILISLGCELLDVSQDKLIEYLYF